MFTEVRMNAGILHNSNCLEEKGKWVHDENSGHHTRRSEAMRIHSEDSVAQWLKAHRLGDQMLGLNLVLLLPSQLCVLAQASSPRDPVSLSDNNRNFMGKPELMSKSLQYCLMQSKGYGSVTVSFMVQIHSFLLSITH